MSTAIEFNNISKIYRLGIVGTGTLAHDLKRWWTINVRGKEDPYLTIGETNDRSTKSDSEYVWALRDIDFKVEQGDVVGIIGKNGAGKSTLLKILSKVTAPTTGTIRARGRIGSLLEVGTGFHPEMTGRENIYMNGAILGMTKAEITKKLDEIVDFSGCERYIDTPVKRYSSGMMVRLGFAVAAHLDPEILVVDEVLAVGDAEFQKKAIGKMQDVSKGEGRTVLFVSHNMVSVRNLCNTGVLLDNGRIKVISQIEEVIEQYLKAETIKDTIIKNICNLDNNLIIDDITVNGMSQSNVNINNDQGHLLVEIRGFAKQKISLVACIIFRNTDGAAMAHYTFNEEEEMSTINGKFILSGKITIPNKIHSGTLFMDIYLHKPNAQFYLEAPKCCKLNVVGYIPASGQIQSFRSGFYSM